ncbi:MAG: TPM domain-containing protein, partial [Promicromonosporaceae bacterium]|nr:TPM domain-containing protein [Promicromonosporaceae bacterium]
MSLFTHFSGHDLPSGARRGWRTVAALVLGLGFALLPALAPTANLPSAAAEPPLTRLDGLVTDTVGALGMRTAEVESALQALDENSDYRLYLVFVETFDDFSAGEWAQETAINTGMTADEILLAIATIDREFGISIDPNSGLTEAQQTRFFNATQNAYTYAITGATDWASATITSIDALRVEVVPEVGGDWAEPLLILTIMAVAGAIILFLVTRRRHTNDNTEIARTEVQDYAMMPTDDLQRRATASLVGIDDALKTDEQELNFAIAEFGVAQTAPFAAALEKAKDDVRVAFQLNQKLTDGDPETDAQRRELLMQIIRICDDAAAVLNSQTQAFDELRKLNERAPELLDQTEQRTVSISEKIPAAHEELVRLHGIHPPETLASVANNATQAEALVKDAKDAIKTGREAIHKGNKGNAVVAARGAQSAVGQA